MPELADAVSAFDRQMTEHLDAKWLQMARNWLASDCTSSNPEDHPAPDMAPNWAGPGTLCGSCSRCRPEQRPPSGDWTHWLYLAGRGAGKTRSCAEYVADQMATNHRWRVCVLAPTFADGRDTCIEGESGIQSVFERWGWKEGPRADYQWNRSIGELTVRVTGSRLKIFTAEKPARLRGPQHHLVWVEELAQVVKRAADAWHMMLFGLRLGRHPRTVSSTTPLPLSVIKDLLIDPTAAVSRGKTDDNASNLPPMFLRELHKKYDGTRLGRQEIGGDMLQDVPGALWRRDWLDNGRVKGVPDFGPTFSEDNELRVPDLPQLVEEILAARGVTLVRIVIGIDPAVKSTEDADESGIIVVGRGDDDRFYVLDDCTLRETPDIVMERLVKVHDLWQANEVIGEINNGGEYIGKALRDTLKLAGRNPGDISFETVHAKKGKRVRAEPISNLYGQGQCSHVGEFKSLEDQITVWTTDEQESPDRMDALCYAIHHLSDNDTSTLYSPSGEVGRHLQQRTTIPTTSVGSRR